MTRRRVPMLAGCVGLVLAATAARGENLEQAWAIALSVNQRLDATRDDSVAAGLNLAAAKAARIPKLQTYTFDTILNQSPLVRIPSSTGATGSTGTGGTRGASGFPTAIPILGAGNTNLPFTFTTVNLPVYTGGKIRGQVNAASAQLNFQRTEEFRTALDLKLTVAEAYIAVLRAHRGLEVARSDLARLWSYTNDVKNRKAQGLATRNDELAAEVSLANARLREIQARKASRTGWATYNRYLGRPMNVEVALEEPGALSLEADPTRMTMKAIRALPEFSSLNEQEIQAMTAQAMGVRPELAGLTERARALDAQADATMAGVKPQVGIYGSYVFLGSNDFVNPNLWATTFALNWTVFDGGVSRRQAQAYHRQECSLLKQRADLAADIALEVRTRWLDLQEARERILVAQTTIAQAEENISVAIDRYRQQLGTNTDVLDAESRRVQSYTNYYDATYDTALAEYRLHRAVGDL